MSLTLKLGFFLFISKAVFPLAKECGGEEHGPRRFSQVRQGGTRWGQVETGLTRWARWGHTVMMRLNVPQLDFTGPDKSVSSSFSHFQKFCQTISSKLKECKIGEQREKNGLKRQ